MGKKCTPKTKFTKYPISTKTNFKIVNRKIRNFQNFYGYFGILCQFELSMWLWKQSLAYKIWCIRYMHDLAGCLTIHSRTVHFIYQFRYVMYVYSTTYSQDCICKKKIILNFICSTQIAHCMWFIIFVIIFCSSHHYVIVLVVCGFFFALHFVSRESNRV